MTMLAAMFYAPLDVRIESIPIPHPGVGEVLLKVVAATTCGTDVKTYLRGHPLILQHIPSRFGHEVSGIVAATGQGVTRCVEGDAIAIANSAPCMHCFYCLHGKFNLCENLLFLNGAYAEYILVPERIVRINLYHLLPESSFIAAALTEPLACALHGIDACEITPGDTVVILGSGPLGLLLAAIAKIKGAYTIITGRNVDRLALASHFGVNEMVDTSQYSLEEEREAILNKTEARRGADIVIEAVGNPETWELATSLVRPGGLVNFFGGCPSGSRVNFETRPLHYSELTFKGVFHHTPAYFAQALELIQGHHIDVEALISARLPLASTIQALELLVKKQGVKYALIPPDFQHDLLYSEVLQ
jgi:L-iditol 2-dehydrogenase